MRKYELSDIQVAQIRNALQMKQASIRRMLNAQVSGSAVHKAYAAELEEVTAILDMFSI